MEYRESHAIPKNSMWNRAFFLKLVSSLFNSNKVSYFACIHSGLLYIPFSQEEYSLRLLWIKHTKTDKITFMMFLYGTK